MNVIEYVQSRTDINENTKKSYIRALKRNPNLEEIKDNDKKTIYNILIKYFEMTGDILHRDEYIKLRDELVPVKRGKPVISLDYDLDLVENELDRELLKNLQSGKKLRELIEVQDIKNTRYRLNNILQKQFKFPKGTGINLLATELNESEKEMIKGLMPKLTKICKLRGISIETLLNSI